MSELFLKILNMSIAASWLVLTVLVLRAVLKKSPKWINVLLWGMVAVRLICPISFESVWSLIPSAETIPANIAMETTPAIDSGVKVINQVINPMIRDSNTPANGASVNPLQIKFAVLTNIWALGIVGMALYTAVSYLRLQRKVDTAVLFRDNIYQNENVASPFVLGIIKPKIYVPFKIEESDLEHVIAHEKAHIRRKDHLWKPLGFLLLTIHWFNPLMWLAYVLLCRDIELACDEKVIKELGNEARADYTQALLSCSVNRRTIAACPLAFGEVGVKERVKSVMNYKKPGFWVMALAVLACAVVAVCFLTNPKENSFTYTAEDANQQSAADGNEADMLASLEDYYKEELPVLASDPYVLFADSESGMIVFGEGAITLTTLIYVTEDGGITWERAGIPEAGKTWHSVVTCATAISSTEYCIGYRYWGEYDGTNFYLTRDSGKTWTRLAPEKVISADITSNMRYAEAKDVFCEDDKLTVQVSCKTESGTPWSIEVKLASDDMGETWEVIETWEQGEALE